ncbi:hypothetical protein, partial [Streptomyces sp. rh34]|uniref:hypothetical protein n=1 Tax=Streptomyces sp. rh34 TaxID=2034272 RepID=UPI001C54EBC2
MCIRDSPPPGPPARHASGAAASADGGDRGRPRGTRPRGLPAPADSHRDLRHTARHPEKPGLAIGVNGW